MLLLLLLILSTPSLAEPIEPTDIRVIDGDTKATLSSNMFANRENKAYTDRDRGIPSEA
jgi:hypothetical protein